MSKSVMLRSNNFVHQLQHAVVAQMEGPSSSSLTRVSLMLRIDMPSTTDGVLLLDVWD